MTRLACAPEKLRRLQTTLRDETAHEIAFAVEQGKIAANSDTPGAAIALDMIERGLTAPLSAQALTDSLARHAAALDLGAEETLLQAGLAAQAVQTVIYVGGSSLMRLVPDTMRRRFPEATHQFSEVFTAVADGLAIAAAQADA